MRPKAYPLKLKEIDVLIVGSGVAGAIIAKELTQAGKKVVILEAGPRLDRAKLVENFIQSPTKDFMSPYPNSKHAPHPNDDKKNPYLISRGSFPYSTQYVRGVGGTTWHWAASTWRFLPKDFKLKTNYGVGQDWPLDYEFLEPYYYMAEVELGVSGFDEIELGSPRSQKYPMKGIPFTYMDKYFDKKLAPHGYKLISEPAARNSTSYNERPTCCGSNNCMPICPIGAQYSANTTIEQAEKKGAVVIENAVAYFLEQDDKKKITSVYFKNANGESFYLSAKKYVVAANAIETPKLLLISGVANSSDQVGRNLMDHPGIGMNFTLPDPVYPGRGPQETSSFVHLRDGEFRKKMSGKKLHLSNVADIIGSTWRSLEQGDRGSDLDKNLLDISNKKCLINSFHEQLPNPDNRITIDPKIVDAIGIPKPIVTFSIDDYVQKSIDETKKTYEEMAKILNASNIEISTNPYLCFHIMGTTRMGDDPKTSVTNKFGQTHDHPNLYIAGSSLFCSSSSVNPTLTIAALSFSTAETMLKTLNN